MTVGLILAGGQGRRMGGTDKALLMLRGKTLIERVVMRARPQVDELTINTNGNPARYAEFGCEVISDPVDGFLGPLAGILGGLEWVRANRKDTRWLATFPCDSPFFPADLVTRLTAEAEAADVSVAIASSGGRDHPVFGLWSTDIDFDAEQVLVQAGMRRMDSFVDALAGIRVEFPAQPFDPFFNINTPEDLARAELLLA